MRIVIEGLLQRELLTTFSNELSSWLNQLTMTPSSISRMISISTMQSKIISHIKKRKHSSSISSYWSLIAKEQPRTLLVNSKGTRLIVLPLLYRWSKPKKTDSTWYRLMTNRRVIWNRRMDITRWMQLLQTMMASIRKSFKITQI